MMQKGLLENKIAEVRVKAERREVVERERVEKRRMLEMGRAEDGVE